MEQLHQGFSDSTHKAGSDWKYCWGHFDPFYIKWKYRPIGWRLRNHPDQPEKEYILSSKKISEKLREKNISVVDDLRYGGRLAPDPSKTLN